MNNLFNPREKHQEAILGTGMVALGEPHETAVRAADGTVSMQFVDMTLTGIDVERIKVLGIELQNSEALTVTVSLSALGYRPRPGREFPIDGKTWLVHSRPSLRGDLCQIVLERRTS